MASDKKLIIGNWKMNLNMHDSSLYLHKLAGMVKTHRDVEVVLAPSMLTIQSLSLQINLKQFKLASQNFYWRDSGAYTGEVSAAQLSGIVQYSIIGHSERRHIFNETEKDIRNKVAAAVRNKITPILCIGETAWEKSAGETKDIIHDQLMSGLANLTSEEVAGIVIAYEPVWAIGTGKNESPDGVTAAAGMIRNQIEYLYGKKVANAIRVIYGGSVTALNVGEYLNLDAMDGLLVGGASLNAHVFCEIIELAHKSSKEEQG